MQNDINKQVLLEKLIELGYIDANIKNWGRQTIAGLVAYKNNNHISELDNNTLIYLTSNVKPADIQTTDQFTKNIVTELIAQGFFISRGRNRNNIIYIRGCNLDGSINNKGYQTYNDLRLILTVEHNGVAYIKYKCCCAVDFGEKLARGKVDIKPFKIVTPQQTWAWMVGLTPVNGYQEGLAQVRPIKISKTSEENILTEDYKNLGVNQYGGNLGRIGGYCAKPLAGEGIEKHQEFIDILKNDTRYLVSENYVFATSFLDGFKCCVLG